MVFSLTTKLEQQRLEVSNREERVEEARKQVDMLENNLLDC